MIGIIGWIILAVFSLTALAVSWGTAIMLTYLMNKGNKANIQCQECGAKVVQPKPDKKKKEKKQTLGFITKKDA